MGFLRSGRPCSDLTNCHDCILHNCNYNSATGCTGGKQSEARINFLVDNGKVCHDTLEICKVEKIRQKQKHCPRLNREGRRNPDDDDQNVPLCENLSDRFNGVRFSYDPNKQEVRPTSWYYCMFEYFYEDEKYRPMMTMN